MNLLKKLFHKTEHQCTQTQPSSGGESEPQTEADKFRCQLIARINQNFPGVLADADNQELKEISIHYRNHMESLKNPPPNLIFNLPELGIETAWPAHENQQIDRQLRRVLTQVLQELRLTIDQELGENFSEQYDNQLLPSDS